MSTPARGIRIPTATGVPIARGWGSWARGPLKGSRPGSRGDRRGGPEGTSHRRGDIPYSVGGGLGGARRGRKLSAPRPWRRSHAPPVIADRTGQVSGLSSEAIGTPPPDCCGPARPAIPTLRAPRPNRVGTTTRVRLAHLVPSGSRRRRPVSDSRPGRSARSTASARGVGLVAPPASSYRRRRGPRPAQPWE